MLLTRYGDIEPVLRLPVIDGLDQCDLAREKAVEKKHWDMWLSKFPYMTKKNFMTFEQFYKKPVKTQASRKSAHEILENVQKIKMKFDERRASHRAI